MSKTLEELAEEFATDWHKDCDYPAEILRHTKKATETVFLAGYKAAKPWISVKERLPEEGEEVLVFGQYLNDIPKVLGVRSRYKGDQDWKYTWEGYDEWVYRENDVTHWMPLPEAPKEG